MGTSRTYQTRVLAAPRTMLLESGRIKICEREEVFMHIITTIFEVRKIVISRGVSHQQVVQKILSNMDPYKGL